VVSDVAGTRHRQRGSHRCSFSSSPFFPGASGAPAQGLTLAHFRAQPEHLRDTSLTLELNLSTFGTHPRVNLDYMRVNERLN
jgi:hypothetical protein